MGGYANISINVRDDISVGSEIINYGTVYFPSAPEITRTNGIVSIVGGNQGPIANAGSDKVAYSLQKITFDGSGSYDPDGMIKNYSWSFGDNSKAYGKVVSHTYLDDGNYTVTLTVTDDQGAFVFKQGVRWEPALGEAEREAPHYVVVAKHADHGIYFAKLFEGDTLDKVTIVIQRRLFGQDQKPTRTIKVEDPEGNPIAGARIFLCGSRLIDTDRDKTERKYQYMRIMQDIGVASAVSNAEGMAEVVGVHSVQAECRFILVLDGMSA